MSEFPPEFKFSRKIKNSSGLFYNCKNLYKTVIPNTFWPNTNFVERIINMSNTFNTNPTNQSGISTISGTLSESVIDILWNDKTKYWVVSNVFPSTVLPLPSPTGELSGWVVQ